MSKYEMDNFLTPPDLDMICCICRSVPSQPVETPCQHVFCKDCIATWLSDQRSCPICRESLSNSHLKPVLPSVRNMINRLLVKCENHDQGCGWGVELEAYELEAYELEVVAYELEVYERHVKECDHALVGCLNDGCVRNILRKDMLKHEKECVHRLTKCKKGCGLPITVAGMKGHSCVLKSFKNNMQAMEDSVDKCCRDLEDKLRLYEGLQEHLGEVIILAAEGAIRSKTCNIF